MFGPRAFYALALLLIVGGVATYTRDPDWNLPTSSKTARVAAPSSGQAAAPGSGGPTAVNGAAPAGKTPAASPGAAGTGGATTANPAAKPAAPGKSADANGAAPANTRSTFRRITADSRDSTASIESSKPNATSAAGLLGDPADPSGGKSASSGRAPAPAADSEADRTSAGKADEATKPPAAQAAKERATAEADADRHEGGKKARQARRRLLATSVSRRQVERAKQAEPTKHVERAKRGERTRWAQRYSRPRLQPWERRTAVAARSAGYGGYGGYAPSYNSCRLETRWAMTAVGYQPVWVRVCD